MLDESDETLAASLGQLPREKTPPAGLENVTVTALRGAGLLSGRGGSRFNIGSWVLAASVAAVAFTGGVAFARRAAMPPPVAPTVQPTFALLLYGPTGSGEDSATHAMRAVEYNDWANAYHPAGRIIGGEAFGVSVAALAVAAAGRGTDSVIVDDEPMGNNDFVGYFLVQARDRDAAVQLARNCPHLKYGGKVVVRRVWPSQASTLAITPVKDSGLR